MRLIFRNTLIVIAFISFIGCKSTVNIVEINTLKEVVENKKYTFEANSANPMAMAGVSGLQNLLPMGSNQANINLIGIPNFLTVKNDSISLDMPYYGIRRIAGAYNSSDAGLNFNGKASEEKIKFNAKRNSYLIKYEVKNTNNESFILTLTLYANKIGNLNVISSHRNSISYNGTWKKEK